jgi:hypothetical protein
VKALVLIEGFSVGEEIVIPVPSELYESKLAQRQGPLTITLEAADPDGDIEGGAWVVRRFGDREMNDCWSSSASLDEAIEDAERVHGRWAQDLYRVRKLAEVEAVERSAVDLERIAGQRWTVENLGQPWTDVHSFARCEQDHGCEGLSIEPEHREWRKHARKCLAYVLAKKLPLTLASMEIAFKEVR